MNQVQVSIPSVAQDLLLMPHDAAARERINAIAIASVPRELKKGERVAGKDKFGFSLGADGTRIIPPAQSSVAQATQAAPVSGLRFVLMNRPQRGNDLFAHTAAAFEALGLFAGEYVERQTMLRVWGETALKYHAEKFRREDGAYALNDEGFSKFGEWRTIDPEKAAAFFELLTQGKTDAACIHASYRAVKPV